MEHTQIKFTQNPTDYGSFKLWDYLTGALAITCFMGLLLAAYIII